MGENATPDHRAMSLHLARALDEIGLNTLTVKRRRHTYLYMEQMRNLRNLFVRKFASFASYHFGSQTEGTTTPGMNSDIDELYCVNVFNVIEDLADLKLGKINLLMLQEDTAPGYCRLQLLWPGVPIGEDLSSEGYCYDVKDRVLLNNTCFDSNLSLDHVRNGPALSLKGVPGYSIDFDNVPAMSCKNWPRQTEDFIRRRRRHGWPSKQLLEEATSHGVFLVPVGHKLSPTNHLEWRISASFAERYLMFSLTIVHIKCLAVLKLLRKTFLVEPLIQDCISSYHCKTALLYCTENTEPGFWKEDNLLACVIRCLEMLRNWINDLFCPQFIFSKDNLFAGKMTAENRDLVLSILNKMLENDGHVLLRVTIDNLGQKLQTQLNTKPSRVPLTDSLASVKLVGEFEIRMQYSINETSLCSTVALDKSGDHISVIRGVYYDIVKFQGRLEGTCKQERQAIKSLIRFLSCWLGSLLASFSLAHNMKIPREAIQHICTAAKYDMSSMLKLASIFYCNGNIKKTEILLQTLETFFCRNTLQVVCGCIRKYSIDGEFVHIMYAMRDKKARARLFAHCVRYSRHEIHCVPPALRQELDRDVGHNGEHSDPDVDTWMALAVVDCRPYLYYLQYLTYKQLGMREIQQQSLRNLAWCAKEDKTLRHRETAWNLLGQCYESDKKPDAATDCYLASLEVRPRNNAANKHLRNLGVADPTWPLRRRWLKTAGKILLVTLVLLIAVELNMQIDTAMLLFVPFMVIMKRFTRFQHMM